MAAHVLRLRLALLLGALRGDRRHLVRRLSGLVLVVAATVAACVALLRLRDNSFDAAEVVTVVAGSAVALGFLVAPLVTGAVDPLDPRRFVVLDVRPASLAPVLAGAGLVSVPVLAVVAVAVAAGALWIDRGTPPVVVIVAVVLAVVTASLAARVAMAVSALVFRDRRGRELMSLFLLALVVVVVPVGVFFGSLEWGAAVPTPLLVAAEVLAVTPFGAAWALPAATLDGRGLVPTLVAVATVLLLAAAWAAIVRRMLSTTERPAVARERSGLGWFAVAPGTPGGAIAARSLVYWLRDRRHLVNVLVVPVAAVVTVLPLLIAGVPMETAVLVPVLFAALFFGWLPHNDLAYDSTAVWMHLAAGVRGHADRIGRLVPILIIGVPVLAVAVPVAIALHGRWALLPALIGATVSLFLSGLGLSSVASVVSPYAVSRPGDSPFQQPQRVGSASVAAQGLVLLGALVVSAPALWWGWLTLDGDLSYALPALWAGIATGVVVLVAGVAVGGVVFERRGTRLMEFAESA